MAQVIFKRGKKDNLSAVPFNDGQLSVTTDEGKMYIDYLDGEELKRKQLYSGSLTFGGVRYTWSDDIVIPTYEGEVETEDGEKVDKYVGNYEHEII